MLQVRLKQYLIVKKPTEKTEDFLDRISKFIENTDQTEVGDDRLSFRDIQYNGTLDSAVVIFNKKFVGF